MAKRNPVQDAEKHLTEAVEGWQMYPCSSTWREARGAALILLRVQRILPKSEKAQQDAVNTLLAKYGVNPGKDARP